jgi:hypothetical protein
LIELILMMAPGGFPVFAAWLRKNAPFRLCGARAREHRRHRTAGGLGTQLDSIAPIADVSSDEAAPDYVERGRGGCAHRL